MINLNFVISSFIYIYIYIYILFSSKLCIQIINKDTCYILALAVFFLLLFTGYRPKVFSSRGATWISVGRFCSSMVTAWVAAGGCKREGGVGTPDFKWQGLSNGAKNQNPKKALDRNLSFKNSHAEFPSHKISVINGDNKKGIEVLIYTPGHLADYWLIVY